MGYRLNCLDEPIFMAVPKLMLTEFGIHYRLESCVVFLFENLYYSKLIWMDIQRVLCFKDWTKNLIWSPLYRPHLRLASARGWWILKLGFTGSGLVATSGFNPHINTCSIQQGRGVTLLPTQISECNPRNLEMIRSQPNPNCRPLSSLGQRSHYYQVQSTFL